MKIMSDHSAQSSAVGKSRGWKFYIYAKLIEDEYLPLLGRRWFVYFVLAKYANHQTRKCWPSYKTLMKKSGIKNRSTISEAIKLLEALRFISVKRSVGRKSSEYELLGAEWWMPVNGLARETIREVLNQHNKRSQKPKNNGLTSETRIVSTKSIHINNDINAQELTNKLKALGENMRIKP